MRLFISAEQSLLPPQEISAFFSNSKNPLVGALAKTDVWASQWKQDVGTPAWSYNDIEDVRKLRNNLNNSSDTIDAILSDPRVHYLLERRFRSTFFRSTFNCFTTVYTLAAALEGMLRETRPNAIIFHTVPHHLHDYLLSRIAEALSIRTFIIKFTPLPWRTWVCEGVDTQMVCNLGSPTITEVSTETRDYLARLKGTYKNAIPEYERRLANAVKGKHLALRPEITASLRSFASGRFADAVYWASAARHKRYLYKKYEQYSANFSLPKDYVVMFLHFQPERTSVPEGLNYCHHWRGIFEVSQAIPDNFSLIIKEHPAMFRRRLDLRVRDQFFYESTHNLPNVKIAPLWFDTFDLVDRASMIVTLTGTVGFEAIARNKPVLTLGVAAYKDHPSVFNASSATDIRAAVHGALDFSRHSQSNNLDHYLKWVETNSFPAPDHSSFDTMYGSAINAAFYNAIRATSFTQNPFEKHLATTTSI